MISKFRLLAQFSKVANAPLKRALFVNPICQATRSISVGLKNAPEKPRKTPLSAYQLFVKERILEAQPDDAKPRERFRRIAAAWNDLSEETKESYRSRSDCEKEDWMRDCAKYEAFLDSLSEVERNRIKMKELLLKADAKERRQLAKQAVDDLAEKMPKRPGSSFQLFFRDQLERGGFESMKGPELFKAASEKWKELSDFEKERFKSLRKQLYDQYLEELEAWKKN